MSYEKRWAAIPSRAFTADGTTEGQVSLSSTIEFRVKQEIVITANSLPSLELEVKRVDSDTVMYVGPRGGAITNRTDLTGYTIAAGAAIFALEQPRPQIPEKEYNRAKFEEEPVNAERSILVDDFGNKYNVNNPLPTASAPMWDEIDLSYDANQDLDQVQYKKGTTTKTLDLQYDANLNLSKVIKS